MTIQKTLLTSILLNDVLFTELNELNPNNINDRDEKEKKIKLTLKHSLKSCQKLSKHADDMFADDELKDVFADITDLIHTIVDEYVNLKLKVRGHEFGDDADEKLREMFSLIMDGKISLDPNMHAKEYYIKAVDSKGVNVNVKINATTIDDAKMLFKGKNPDLVIKEIR